MLEYREFAPSPRLEAAVECFWTSRADTPGALHRVVPDGCADILLTARGGAARLEAIGPMTAFRDYPAVGGERMLGVRFRPGQWRRIFGPPARELADLVLPLEDLWGARARHLAERLAGASTADAARLFEAELPLAHAPGPVEHALSWLERARGAASIDDLAREAGLSARHFRRACLDAAGLTPKFLARVLRFRHAAARLHAEPAAQVAVECGYYDQAHLIRDFREFAGRSPGIRQF